MKKLLCILALLAVLPFAVACDSAGKKNRNPNIGINGNIDITYYSGGTGKEWINAMAEAFEDATLIKVNLTPDGKATVNAKTMLDSGRNVPDILFLQYTNWREYVQKSWIRDISDLYDGTFTYSVNNITITSSYDIKETETGIFASDADGNAVDKDTANLKEIIAEGFQEYGSMAKNVQSEKAYYVIPWTCPVTGIAYNADMLSDAGYSEPPKTEAELKDLIAKLNARNVTPFSWGGQEMGYWDFITLTWWAQYSGLDKWQAFYQFESADVFNDPGRVEALELWQELLVDPSSGDFINSIDKPMGRDHMNAETRFAAGDAAMTPTGAWLENEIEDFVGGGLNYKMMAVPLIDGAATDEENKPVQVLNTEAGSFACVPSGAKNPDAAKAFLAFMNSPEWLQKFTEISGQPRPFNYYPSRLKNMTPWEYSCFELYETSERMWRVSDSPIFVYAGVTEWPYYGKTSLYGNLSGAKKKTAKDVCDYMHEYAVKQWPTWSKTAGLA